VTTNHDGARRILLGLGEEVEARPPTRDEQSAYEIGADEPVFVVHHADRADEVVPARGRRVAARTYGVQCSPKPTRRP
jgi:hypothetical protein